MRAVLVAASFVAALCACAGGTPAQASPIAIDHRLVRNELTKGPGVQAFLCEKKNCDEFDLASLVDDKLFGAGLLRSEPPYAFGRPAFPGENGRHGRRPEKPGKDEHPVHSVPEPGTLVLLMAGFSVFAARSLRSRQRA